VGLPLCSVWVEATYTPTGLVPPTQK
jgi:hypothetical protein